MLQVDEPDTFVLATGVTVSVRDLVRLACQAADIDVAFEGSGESEIGVDVATGKQIIRVNPAFYRPAEVELLVGDAQTHRCWIGKPIRACRHCRIMMKPT